jgi:hypothetical protein
MILCCEGILLLIGLILLLAAPEHWGNRNMLGRRNWVGVLLMVQAPLALLAGGAALGGTDPGPIDGALVSEARDRIFAFAVESGIILAALLGGFALWITAPKVDDSPLEDETPASS